MEDLAALESGATYILNARVSKQGGLLRTLAIIRAARDARHEDHRRRPGRRDQHPGAGRHRRRAGGGTDLVAFEGAFGTRLLVRDAVTPSIGFGYRGRVQLDRCTGAGLGLTPTAEVANACQ